MSDKLCVCVFVCKQRIICLNMEMSFLKDLLHFLPLQKTQVSYWRDNFTQSKNWITDTLITYLRHLLKTTLKLWFFGDGFNMIRGHQLLPWREEQKYRTTVGLWIIHRRYRYRTDIFSWRFMGVTFSVSKNRFAIWMQ